MQSWTPCTSDLIIILTLLLKINAVLLKSVLLNYFVSIHTISQSIQCILYLFVNIIICSQNLQVSSLKGTSIFYGTHQIASFVCWFGIFWWLQRSDWRWLLHVVHGIDERQSWPIGIGHQFHYRKNKKKMQK